MPTRSSRKEHREKNSFFSGTLLDGTTIMVKQLSSKSKQRNHDFFNEMQMASLQGRNSLAWVIDLTKSNI